MPSNFRFVSVGQGLPDAADFAQTIRGNSLKPLAPGNITASRDPFNNVVFKWSRRSRIAGGMRPFTDVPVAEEAEVYDIEFYDGSTVVRTIRVTTPPAHPVLWENIGATSITPAADGTLLQSAVDSTSSLNSIQRITGDFQLETTIDNSVRLGETQTDGIVRILPVSGSWDTDNSTAPGYTHNDGGLDYFENSGDPLFAVFDLVTGSRLMIELRGKTFYYYKDYAGAQTQPLFTSTRTNIPFPLMIRADLTGSGATSPIVLDNVTKPTLRSDLPTCMYTADQQTADGLTPGNPVKLIIYQVSAIVGRGFPREATL